MNNSEEHTLLLILIVFLTGMVLGRLWNLSQKRRRYGIDNSSIHYIVGLDLLTTRQVDRAITELTVASRDNTDAIEISLVLGNLLREKGQLERAIQIHQGILHRPGITRSERAHILLCLGMDFKKAGFRNRAKDTLREVIALEPENISALSGLTKIYEEEHDWEQALNAAEQMSQKSGKDGLTHKAFIYNEIGKAAIVKNEVSLASQAFNEAIRLQDQLAAPHLHLGDLLEQQGNYDAAESCWLEYATANPKQAHHFFERLERIRTKLDRSENMEELFSYVIQHNEKDWRAHLLMAQIELNRGAIPKAFQYLITAFQNKPQSLTVHLKMWDFLSKNKAYLNQIQLHLGKMSQNALFTDPYICTNCSYRVNDILWRCPHCQEWNTFVEERMDTA